MFSLMSCHMFLENFRPVKHNRVIKLEPYFFMSCGSTTHCAITLTCK